MNTAISTFTHSFQAELLKIKRTPILYISLVGGIFVCGLIFMLHLLNPDNFIKEGQDPWILYFDVGFMITSMVLLIPYVVLTMSSLTHFEHQSSAWKYLYSLPFSKANVYFSKLLLAILLIISTYLIYFLVVWLSAYIVDFIHPDYGFRNYTPNFSGWLTRLIHSFLSILGIAGLHYWMSVRWKNFITPVGIGLLGFIMAMICLMTGKYDYASWIPYAYPGMIGAEMGIEGETVGFGKIGWFYKIELISLACFAIFTTLGYWEEKWRNVK